jgi:outer membrane receptor protein involved in Fe transport
MYHKRPLSLAVSTALGLSTLIMIPGQASAQDQDQQAGEEGDALLEEVIVTGSRIVSDDGFGRTSPVTVVGMDAIESTGLTRVEEILNNLPQIETSFHAFDANGATGTATVDLRGLGTNRTLVLINGRRMQPGGVYTEAPDINQIPTSLIERVEVLTGGASATYGADAVAGVVNFIMRRVDGVEVSAGWSGYQHDNSNDYIQGLMDNAGYTYPTGSTGIDGEAYNMDIVVGGDFAGGRGNATLYATWRKNQALLEGTRDYASCALSNPGTACGGSSTAPVPNYFIYPLLPDPTGNTPVDQRLDYSWPEDFFGLNQDGTFDTGLNIYNYAPINYYMRPQENWSLGGFADFEINEHAVVYSEIMASGNRSDAQIAESGTFYYAPYPFAIDDPLFTDAFRSSLNEYFPGVENFGIYIGKRNVEGGARYDSLEHNAFRIVTGLRGAINDNWDYDVSFMYGQTSSSSTYINDLLAPNIELVVDSARCAATAGCIPYEVFTYGGVTPEMAAQLGGTAVQRNQTALTNIVAYVTGNLGFGLPAGDITVAGGYQYGKPEYENISDTIYEQGLLLGQGGPQPSVEGKYSVDEFFIEGNVPLLDGVPMAENLTLDIAYRFSDYTTGFDTDTYRIGFDWQMLEGLRFRTGYNRAVRAPSITELFVPSNLGLWSGTDPCSGDAPAYTAEQCARTGVSASQYGNIGASPAGQYNGIFGGNVHLNPEEADTITFGVVWEPVNDMTLSVDYWDIDITDVIDNIQPEVILEQCAFNNSLCENIQRAGNGSLWQGQSGFITLTNINLGAQHWEGVDLAWAWGMDALAGSWDFNFIGTYMMTKETTPLPSAPESAYDCVGLVSGRCFASPEWRHVASATYDSNEWWAITGRWRYYDEVTYPDTVDQIANDNLKVEQYFDLSAIVRFMGNHDVRFGVNNVLDEEPPLVGGTLVGGINNANSLALYDQLGRYFFANATFRW